MCDDAYSRQEIMAKERDMIETVDYDVGYSLSYRFLRRYGRVSACCETKDCRGVQVIFVRSKVGQLIDRNDC